jgi:hypothetical protein
MKWRMGKKGERGRIESIRRKKRKGRKEQTTNKQELAAIG